MNLARTWPINEADAECKAAHRHGEAERGKQRHAECNQTCWNHHSQFRFYQYKVLGQRAVSIFSRTPRTSSVFLLSKYQSIVFFRPSRNFVFGSQPSSFLARALSATRLAGPVGMSRRKRISAFFPAKSS